MTTTLVLSQRLTPARRDAVTAAAGMLLVAGVFTDGWAHFNRPGLETFFTPWHAALYSALAVNAAWLALVAVTAAPGPLTRRSVPTGYGLSLVGVGVFALGGLTDMVWHQLFGIEVAIDALVSPTHLLLGAGGILLLSTVLRAQRVLVDPRRAWTWSARLSLVLTMAVAVFFLLYVSPFPDPGPLNAFVSRPETSAGHEAAESPVIASLGAYLVATWLVAVTALLLTGRRSRPPTGALTLVVAAVALLPVVVVNLPPVPLAGAAGAVLGAAVTELMVRRRAAGTARPLPPALLAAGLVAAVWTGHLAALALADAVRWPASLWAGMVVITAAAAGATGFVTATRHHDPSRDDLPLTDGGEADWQVGSQGSGLAVGRPAQEE